MQSRAKIDYNSSYVTDVVDNRAQYRVFEVRLFTAVIVMCPSSTLVAMVTENWEFCHKINYKSAYIRVRVMNLAPDVGFLW